MARHRHTPIDPSFMDAARFLPRTRTYEHGFVRFGAPGARIPEEGIFVLAYRTLREETLEPWEEDALRESLSWFAKHMPVCRPPTASAILFLRDRQREVAQRLWDLAHLLRELGVLVEMIAVRRPGRIVREDDIQVAAIPPSR
jgi:hypothetical protein